MLALPSLKSCTPVVMVPSACKVTAPANEYTRALDSVPRTKKLKTPAKPGLFGGGGGGAVALMVTFAETVVDGLAVQIAVMVTLPAAAGAVKVVAAPLAVCAGLKLPQLPVGEQLQSTPSFEESFVTVATILAVAPVLRDVGGAVVNATVIWSL